eukprot:jgi/Botrbrau1/1263/Bobra.0163s0056.1
MEQSCFASTSTGSSAVDSNRTYWSRPSARLWMVQRHMSGKARETPRRKPVFLRRSFADEETSPLWAQDQIFDGIQEWEVPASRAEALVLLERFQHNVDVQGTPTGLNVVALSGGLASALVGYLVLTVYEQNSVACVVNSGEGAEERVRRAKFICDWLGLELYELSGEDRPLQTGDPPAGVDASSVSQRDMQVAKYLMAVSSRAIEGAEDGDAIVFCGLRARDLADPARKEHLLKLTEEGNIAWPLEYLSEPGVAALALVAGFPEKCVTWLASPLTSSGSSASQEEVSCHSDAAALPLDPSLTAPEPLVPG